MKRLILILIFLINTITVFGQIDLGVFGGINRFSLSGEPPENAEYAGKYGYLGGIGLDFFIFDELALSVHPGYNEKGSLLIYRNRFYEDRIDSTFILTQTFVNIPFNFKIFTGNKHFYFLGGVNFDYFIQNTFNKEGEEPNDINYLFRDYDFSINFGLAYVYFFKHFSVFAEFRYTQGVKNMNKPDFVFDEDSNFYIENFKSSGISLLIGFSYRIWRPEFDEE